MLTNRQRQIMKYLNEEDYTTASYIAGRINVSDRTIRSEMKILAEELYKEGIELVSKPKYGYQLHVLNREQYNALVAEDDAEEAVQPVTPQQRVQFILEYLLAHDDYVKIEELCDLLYTSQSTISQDLKTVREILEKNNLKLIQRPYYGMKIEGSEFDLRLCISNYLSNIFESEDGEAVLQRSQLQKISEILELLFEEENYHMSDFAFNNLATHIYIAVQRIKTGNYVPMEVEQLEEIETHKTIYELALRIVNVIEKEFSITVPKSECGYMYDSSVRQAYD